MECAIVDAQGSAYVTGTTSSVDFPTTPGAVEEHAGNRVICFPHACTAVDTAGNAYVVGGTTSRYFPVVDAFQPNQGALFDAFVARLNPDGSRLVYSSYLGGSVSGVSPIVGWYGASAIAVDANGNAGVAGYTQSDDLPTTPNAFQPHLGPGVCDLFGTPCSDGFAVKRSPPPDPAWCHRSAFR